MELKGLEGKVTDKAYTGYCSDSLLPSTVSIADEVKVTMSDDVEQV